jgi:hypothetical protein
MPISMEANNKHREAARSTMSFNRNWPIGADIAGNPFALDSATPDVLRKKLSVKTYVMTDIIAPTAEQIGFNDPTARNIPVTISIIPTMWLAISLSNIIYIHPIRGLLSRNRDMAAASYLVNFIPPNQRNITTRAQRSKASDARDPMDFSAILKDKVTLVFLYARHGARDASISAFLQYRSLTLPCDSRFPNHGRSLYDFCCH